MNSEREFNGDWALILGGSSGLGLATAKKLASHGMNICIVHRDRKSNLPKFNSDVSEMIVHGVEVLSFNVDAIKSESIDSVVSALSNKSIKLVVHSIAKGSVKPMHPAENALAKIDFDITTTAMGTSWYIWTQALIKNKLFSIKARNIGFTSEGNTRVWKGYGAVSVAKATLEALMRQMAVEFAPLDITTNCIQAGATRTPSFDMIPQSDELAKLATHRNPFGRLTKPEDVANAVYLLCKKEADWINGTILKVDGGESLR
ncbi:MAG: enoyl-[acyl-carrier protein] reductase III [Sediminicola sp.]|jgi:enoyl-[acyl-carrier protein] reductase III